MKYILYYCEGKGKGHPITGHEGPEGGVEVYLHYFFNLSAKLEWVVNVMPHMLRVCKFAWNAVLTLNTRNSGHNIKLQTPDMSVLYTGVT